jgi:SAM-dependent methyltransferase
VLSKLFFARTFLEFKRLSAANAPRFLLRWKDRYPCLNDNTNSTNFDRHYIYHPAWAARVLAGTKPSLHVDFSSTLSFCSMLSAFTPVKFYDFRSTDLQLSNLTSESADLLDLPLAASSIESLSCMHVVEHIGLGRYGDRLDPDGDLKAISELKRVLAPEGTLLFVVPIGKPKIIFNAHRIYSYEQIATYFSELELKEFALIPDDPSEGGLILDATKEEADKQTYGCGCFWFRKS